MNGLYACRQNMVEYDGNDHASECLRESSQRRARQLPINAFSIPRGNLIFYIRHDSEINVEC